MEPSAECAVARRQGSHGRQKESQMLRLVLLHEKNKQGNCAQHRSENDVIPKKNTALGGGGTKPGAGPGGNCVCPQCGKKIPHIAGRRCADRACPDCGTRMIKE